MLRKRQCGPKLQSCKLPYSVHLMKGGLISSGKLLLEERHSRYLRNVFTWKQVSSFLRNTDICLPNYTVAHLTKPRCEY